MDTQNKTQRGIKFRAWYREGKCWLDSVCVFGDGSWYGSLIGENGIEVEGYDERECELMQYTGLLDKNRKEIYEGDIVIGFPTGNQPAIVDFAHGAFMTYWKARDEWRWLYQSTYVWEVIGNIYEGLHSGEKCDIIEEWKKNTSEQSQSPSRDTKLPKKQDEKLD